MFSPPVAFKTFFDFWDLTYSLLWFFGFSLFNSESRSLISFPSCNRSFTQSSQISACFSSSSVTFAMQRYSALICPQISLKYSHFLKSFFYWSVCMSSSLSSPGQWFILLIHLACCWTDVFFSSYSWALLFQFDTFLYFSLFWLIASPFIHSLPKLGDHLWHYEFELFFSGRWLASVSLRHFAQVQPLSFIWKLFICFCILLDCLCCSV